MCGALAPAGEGGVAGLHGVAQVLAVALGHLANGAALRVDDRPDVRRVGAHLLAANVQLERAIHPAARQPKWRSAYADEGTAETPSSCA